MDDPEAKEIPTQEELARRREFLDLARQLGAEQSDAAGPFPSAEEMQREDRLR
ncbi:MAG TPA: hypothetical protein VN893_01920 [Bryobacteraceae bacterium]|nr:hypothetical protein [Bryobacteraceae bacterium]